MPMIGCLFQCAHLGKHRRKYWDKDYVQSLEEQVALLTSRLCHTPTSEQPSPPSSTVLATTQPSGGFNTSTDRLSRALTEFASLTWAPHSWSSSQLPLFSGPAGRFSIPFRKELPTFEDVADSPNAPCSPFSGSPTPTACPSLDLGLKRHLKEVFLNQINIHYNFVDPSWLLFSDVFPDNDIALQFLYGAIFAVSSHISPKTDESTTVSLLAFAEKRAMECCQEHLCLPVVQALLILAWYKQTIQASAHGYMYHCMSSGSLMYPHPMTNYWLPSRYGHRTIDTPWTQPRAVRSCGRQTASPG